MLAESKYLMSASEDLVIALYRLGLVQRSIARHALAELGSQGFTALAVIQRQGPVRVSEVAEQLSVDLSVASRQVAALVLAGYVEREPDPDDRRASRLRPTAAWHARAHRLAPADGRDRGRRAGGLVGGRSSPGSLRSSNGCARTSRRWRRSRPARSPPHDRSPARRRPSTTPKER